jgi:hypothetical protein
LRSAGENQTKVVLTKLSRWLTCGPKENST